MEAVCFNLVFADDDRVRNVGFVSEGEFFSDLAGGEVSVDFEILTT